MSNKLFNHPLWPALLAAITFSASTGTMAAPADTLCGLVDEGLQASLQLQRIDPVHTVQTQEIPGAGPVNTISCTWSSPALGRVLTLTSTTAAIPGDVPASCHEQKAPDQSMIMCMVSSGGPLVTAALIQKGQNADSKLLPVLRAHTEAVARKWSKLARKP